jgi:hypothetical protein
MALTNDEKMLYEAATILIRAFPYVSFIDMA